VIGLRRRTLKQPEQVCLRLENAFWFDSRRYYTITAHYSTIPIGAGSFSLPSA